jgi:hypothetical protein
MNLARLRLQRSNDNVKHLWSFFTFFSRGDGKRFVARADEKLTAFAELEAQVKAAA